jgi:DNA-binding transcriptional regulator YdaS (Cro superfamily)
MAILATMKTMTLAEYIADADRRAALAKRLATSPQYLWQIATGWRDKRPSALFARKIEEATEGAVTRYELRPDVFGPAPDEAKAA